MSPQARDEDKQPASLPPALCTNSACSEGRKIPSDNQGLANRRAQTSDLQSYGRIIPNRLSGQTRISGTPIKSVSATNPQYRESSELAVLSPSTK